MNFRRLLVPAVLLVACSPKPADTDGDSGSSSGATGGAEATSATNASPTTSGGTTTGLPTTVPATIPTSAEDTATVPVPETSTGDTGDETGGIPGLPGACTAVCMHWDACEPGSAGPLDACIADCLADVEVPSPCAMANSALWNCVVDLPCEEALKFLGGPDEAPPTSCLEELQAVDEICVGVECGGEIGGGDDFCELMQDCDGEQQSYACDIQTNLCTCSEDGVPGKQCPADGFCALDHAEQIAAITACCGWEWMGGG